MIDFPDTLHASIRDVIQSYPKAAQNYALNLRGLILEIATDDPRIGPLTETLKWREPSYLTEKTKSGTILRYDWESKRPAQIGLFVNCQTTLIHNFRDQFESALEFEGTRAIWLNIDAPLPQDILSICIGKTLAYHIDK